MDRPCILHGKTPNRDGYARCTHNGKRELLHRVMYSEYNLVPISNLIGFVVRHTCDNSGCIEPTHLVLGTHADNVADKVARDRTPRAEAHICAKLSANIVAEIRASYIPYHAELGGAALARKYGVSASTVHECLSGDTWRRELG